MELNSSWNVKVVAVLMAPKNSRAINKSYSEQMSLSHGNIDHCDDNVALLTHGQ